MIFFVIQALYFFLPAYAANVAPVVSGTLFSYPIDAFCSFRGVRVFGENKTWGGLLGGVLLGTLVFFIQQVLYVIPFFHDLSLFDYSIMPTTLGFFMAFGALLGDLVKSFVKRRLGRTPGSSWFLFDQIDYVLGAFVFIIPFYMPSAALFLILLLLAPVFHYAANYLAFTLGLKKVWW